MRDTDRVYVDPFQLEPGVAIECGRSKFRTRFFEGAMTGKYGHLVLMR